MAKIQTVSDKRLAPGSTMSLTEVASSREVLGKVVTCSRKRHPHRFGARGCWANTQRVFLVEVEIETV